jgi:LacI family transcriptional regulator
MVRLRAATSTDVARQAGVSQATVSVVLNGARSSIRVSDATRRRVLDAATALGYAPHPAARALRRRSSGIIGYLPRRARGLPFEHPIHYLLTIHATRAALDRGYQLLDAGAETDTLRDNDELLAFLINRRVDGVILDNPQTAGEVRRILDHGLPVVQLLRPQPLATPTITVDAAPGIAAAIDHLVGLGHRAIAFLGKGGPQPVDRARLDAFAAATARHGLAIPDDYIRLITDDYSLEYGRALTRDLLALPARPTAIFAASDSLALGAAHALYEAKVRVPTALSLVSGG